jgi:O-antigen/teichoic acid export membrane protein
LAQKETTYQLSRVAFILLVFPAISLAALCFVSSSDMMVLLYKTPSYFSRSIFPILMLSFIPICANYVYGTLITANGNLGFLNKLSLFVLLLNVILNYMLIPSLKAEGTAIASLVTHSVLCVSYLLFCVTHKLININIKFIAKTLAYAAIVITCAYLVARFSLQIKVLLLAVASVVSLWILRLVSYQELLKILPSRLKNNIE